MSLGSESETDGALVDGLDRVLDLVQPALRTPHGHIGVVLVAEHDRRPRDSADLLSPIDEPSNSYELE